MCLLDLLERFANKLLIFVNALRNESKHWPLLLVTLELYLHFIKFLPRLVYAFPNYVGMKRLKLSLGEDVSKVLVHLSKVFFYVFFINDTLRGVGRYWVQLKLVFLWLPVVAYAYYMRSVLWKLLIYTIDFKRCRGWRSCDLPFQPLQLLVQSFVLYSYLAQFFFDPLLFYSKFSLFIGYLGIQPTPISCLFLFFP